MRATFECPENKNLLTNFHSSDKALYELAIREYGRDDVFVTNEAYWMDGTRDTSMCALRCKNPNKDYSEFWDVFERVARRLI